MVIRKWQPGLFCIKLQYFLCNISLLTYCVSSSTDLFSESSYREMDNNEEDSMENTSDDDEDNTGTTQDVSTDDTDDEEDEDSEE